MKVKLFSAAVAIARLRTGSKISKKTLSTKAGGGKDYFNRPGPWDDKSLNCLLDANKKWTRRMAAEKPDFFEELKKGHAPKILWIGCSDARVPANDIIGEPPGSVFVHRNIANLVINTDFSCMSVLQYAVDVLKVKHIIVCGHYDCGGIKAALVNRDHKSPLENWLRGIRDVHRQYREELKAIESVEARQRRLVELNVVEQCLNLYKTAVVQRRRVETQILVTNNDPHIKFAEPRIHGLVYEPTTGIAKMLDQDFKHYLAMMDNVYNLYQLDTHEVECELTGRILRHNSKVEGNVSVDGDGEGEGEGGKERK